MYCIAKTFKCNCHNQKPKSTSWKELRAFSSVDSSLPSTADIRWNQPFPFDVPFFPADCVEHKVDSALDTNAANKGTPAHLPPYPPAHTYKKTSSRKRISVDNNEDVQYHPNKRVSTVRSAQQSLAMIEDSLEG